MFDVILNFLYPSVCGFCDKICKESLCKKCEAELRKYGINNLKFNNIISVFKYEGIIRKKIIEYKFGDKAYLYKTFAKVILKNKKICGILKSYDIMIPVPLYKKKRYVRGYNQTELIAKELTKSISNLKFANNILTKIRNTEVQSLLTRKKRKENVKKAFKVSKHIDELQNKRVILFDDIYTTGATSNECSKILKQSGAKEVLVLTLAKD